MEPSAAVQEIVQALGYQRAGSRVAQSADNAITTAVRRGILEHQDGRLKLLARSIEDYNRDFIKDQFLVALGRAWTDREEAIRSFARALGFARTGPSIEQTGRSLINGLLRDERI